MLQTARSKTQFSRFLPTPVAGAVAAVALAAALLVSPSSAVAAPVGWAAATCSDFPNQAAAQRAHNTRDADGDGIYCESLPCPCLKPGQGGGQGGGGGRTPRRKKRAPKRAQAIAATITKAVDGDTVKVRAYGAARRFYTIRLIGIDAPESSALRYGRADCGGADAKRYMKRIAPYGLRVTLRTDPTQDTFDRYGRLLAYVDRRGGSLQARMLRAGWAGVYVYSRPFQRLRGFRRAQAFAKRRGRGVYRLCGGRFHRAKAAAASGRMRAANAARRAASRYVRRFGISYSPGFWNARCAGTGRGGWRCRVRTTTGQCAGVVRVRAGRRVVVGRIDIGCGE